MCVLLLGRADWLPSAVQRARRRRVARMSGGCLRRRASTYILLRPIVREEPRCQPFSCRRSPCGSSRSAPSPPWRSMPRARASAPKDVEHERVLDDLPEGLAVNGHRAEAERGLHAAGPLPPGAALPRRRAGDRGGGAGAAAAAPRLTVGGRRHLHPRRARGHGRAGGEHLGGGEARGHAASRTSATPTPPAIAPTATAAPAWSRSRASGCWRRPASASRRRAWWCAPRASGRSRRGRWSWSSCSPTSRRRRRRTTGRASSGTWRRCKGSRRAASRRGSGCPPPDASHVAMRVNLDACIHCNLCVRACREVQVNDVIGMAGRGFDEADRLRHGRPDGRLDLRRLRRVRAGLPHRRADGGDARSTPRGAATAGTSMREVRSVCPYCGVGCQVSYKLKDGQDRLGGRGGRPGERGAALRQGALRLRLREPSAPADPAADPPRRRAREGAERRSGEPPHPLPRGELGRGARRRGGRARPAAAARTAGRRWPGSAAPSARTRRRISSRS